MKMSLTRRIRLACTFFISKTRLSIAYANMIKYQVNCISIFIILAICYPITTLYIYYRHNNTLKTIFNLHKSIHNAWSGDKITVNFTWKALQYLVISGKHLLLQEHTCLLKFISESVVMNFIWIGIKINFSVNFVLNIYVFLYLRDIEFLML